tara:strand:+ start:17 stop:457 length:441 start_codon:yes stop_codon:yes gene_type:complete
MIFKEYKNFFTLEECNELIHRFKQNVCFHHRWRDTILFRLKKTPPKLIDTLQKDFNITLNYGQIVFWPDYSRMEYHYDGTIAKENDFTSICYLNEDFTGGRTLVEDKIIDPEIGKLIAFNSKNIKHGVEEVQGGRFTYIAWWKKQQ